jgi:hypothetical protein
MTSPDGITWTSRTSAADNEWRSVAYGNGLFVAVSISGTNRVMTSPDGITWTSRTAATDTGWLSVTDTATPNWRKHLKHWTLPSPFAAQLCAMDWKMR